MELENNSDTSNSWSPRKKKTPLKLKKGGREIKINEKNNITKITGLLRSARKLKKVLEYYSGAVEYADSFSAKRYPLHPLSVLIWP